MRGPGGNIARASLRVSSPAQVGTILVQNLISDVAGWGQVPGSYWYYGLVTASLLLLGASLWHRRDWKLLVLSLCVASVIHPFEMVVAVGLGAYSYLPGILKPPVDNFIGAFISDYCIVPASAVVISAFALAWPARILSAAIFTGVDWYFTVLGIYAHHWWKSVYTGILLLVLYAISDWLWDGLQAKRPTLAFRLLIIFLCYAASHNVLTFAANRGDQLFVMALPWWPALNPLRVHILLINLYQIIVAVTVTLCSGLRLPLALRLLAPVVIIILEWALGYFGIFVPQADITPYHLALVPVISVALVIGLFRAAKLDGYLFP
jgi:hypothetical protein